MKTLFKFLPFLTWLVVLTLGDSKPPLLDPPLDIHPEVLMKLEGQFMCLENDPMNMDILRRHENTLRIYPEVTVGCEAISRKPLKEHFDAPTHGTTFDEEIRKYFIIDATGVEQRVNKSGPVVIEVYTSDLTSAMMVPNATRTRTKLEFHFHEICFPIACYESDEVFHQACVTDVKAATKSSFVNFDCLPYPGKENPGKYGDSEYCLVASYQWRKVFKGHTGPAAELDPETSVYCIGSGPTLGPLRTRKYPVGQMLMSGRKGKNIESFYKYVHQYDLYSGQPTQKLLKRGSFIAYNSGGYVDIEGEMFFLGCAISAPIEAPYNDTFGVHHLIMRGKLNKETQPFTIKNNDPFDIQSMYSPAERGPSLIIKFEDLCFPADCKGKAVEDYKCKGKYKQIKPKEYIFRPTLSYAAHDLIYKKFLYPYDYEHASLAKGRPSIKLNTL